jgi:molecular chaperone DnaK
MRVLGVDFGTSNTVALLRFPDGRVRPLLFDGSPLLPSAVYLGNDGRVIVGRDAERNARVDPGRFEPNPKRRIDDGSILLGDREIPVAHLIAAVLGQLATEVRRQIGGMPEMVRMTHPARWADRRRSVLVEAAAAAGLPRPQLVAEPVAAAYYFSAVLGTSVPVGRSLAIYDLGGGTFDATVIRRSPQGFEVLAEGGLPDVGGLDFDHAVIEHLGGTYSHSHPQVWQRLLFPVDGTDRRHRRMLYEDVRGAKEMLSRTANADIHLPALEVDAHLVREELERLIRPYLDRTVRCLEQTIAEARLSPRELVGIFLVGGSSRIPLCAHLIHSQLGMAPTTLEQPETVVAEGSLQVGEAPPRPSSVPPAQRPQPQPARFQPTSGGPSGPQGGMPMNRPGMPMGPGGPVSLTRPAVQPPPAAQQQPVSLNRPQPMPNAAPASPAAARPRPMGQPMPAGGPVRQSKRWYQEPTVVVTYVVAGLLILGFVAMLIAAVSK